MNKAYCLHVTFCAMPAAVAAAAAVIVVRAVFRVNREYVVTMHA